MIKKKSGSLTGLKAQENFKYEINIKENPLLEYNAP
jgi:hypothetical protein